MDEKKVRYAIEDLKALVDDCKYALEAIRESARESSVYNKEIIVIETAIEALEKQLPMMTESAIVEFAYGTFEERICPKCEEILEFGKYCPNCGQRLDWPET